MKSSTRWRQLWLRATILACLALGLLAGTASATLSMDTSTDTEVTIASDHHYIQSAIRPISYRGYQYIGYWDAADPIDGRLYLKLTRRRLSDGNLTTIRFATEPYVAYLAGGFTDGHNYVGLGLSPNDGTIHIAWSLHTGDRRMRYLYSNTRCMERTQEEFTAANCRFELRFYMAERAIEERITYPTFINDQRDRLWFTQRYDAASRGDQFLNSYDETAHTWTLVGEILRGRVEGAIRAPENEYSFRVGATEYRARERGVYVYGMEFDKNERLHVAWAWRENAGGLVGQHGIHYAYSRDGGRTWYGRSPEGDVRIADVALNSLAGPIGIDDLAATQVVSSAPGYFTQGAYMTLDSDNNPHVFGSQSDVQTTDQYEANMLQKHYWRDTAGNWYSQFVQPTEDGNIHPAYTSMFLDRANIAYGFLTRSEIPWDPWNAGGGEYVYNELPPANMTWQPDGERDGFLNIALYSELTCIDSNEIIGAAIETRGNTQIRMRMKNETAETDLIASWTTQESRTWSVARQQRFTRAFVERDRNYTEYTLTVTDADWAGTLRELELCTADGPRTGSQSIDWIKITNAGGTAAYTWEFTRGNTLYGAEAGVNGNWSTWTIEELLPGVDLTAGLNTDSIWAIDRQRYKTEKVVDFLAMVQGEPGTETLSLREFDIAGDDIAKDWRFETDVIGWTGVNVESLRWADDAGTKVLSGSLDRRSSDPQLFSVTNLKIPLGSTTEDNVHVRMKNTSRATRAKLYFITDADRTYNETKSIEFTIRAESGYTIYDIDMSRVSGWRSNTLYQLRLDPTNDTTREGSFKVDRIYIMDT